MNEVCVCVCLFVVRKSAGLGRRLSVPPGVCPILLHGLT